MLIAGSIGRIRAESEVLVCLTEEHRDVPHPINYQPRTVITSEGDSFWIPDAFQLPPSAAINKWPPGRNTPLLPKE